MILISNETIKSIKSNYGEEHPNESFCDDLLCRIVDENTFSLNSIALPFCDDTVCQSFWHNSLKNDVYLHLFPYLVLSQWRLHNPNNEILNNWQNSFEVEFCKEIEEEATHFKKDCISCKLDKLTLVHIGFHVDAFLWKNKMEAPFFMEFASIKNVSIDEIYDNYVYFLMSYIDGCDAPFVRDNIDSILKYSQLTDNIIHNNKCFLCIINKFTESELEDLDVEAFLIDTSHETSDIILLKKVLSHFCINANELGSLAKTFAFCSEVDDISFWRTNKNSIDFLLLYAALKSLLPVAGVEYWLDILHKEYSNYVEDEIRFFLDKINRCSTDSFSLHFVNSIVLISESYLWEHDFVVPSYMVRLKYESTTVNNYRDRFLHYVKENIETSKEQIENCLQYCLIVDKGQKNDMPLLANFLLILFPNEDNLDLKQILVELPFINDNFNSALLQYCKNNASLYSFSSEFIRRIEFSYHYKSWMSEINSKIENTGRPYNIEICRKTNSHKAIIKFLNTRQSIFWNRCHQITLKLVDDIAATSSTTKQNDLKVMVNERIKILCNEEETLIISKISQLVKDARHEAYYYYINETKDDASAKGKELPLTDDVISSIIETLSGIYDISEIPPFSRASQGDYLTFSSRFASIWVEHNIFSPDEMNTIDRSSDNYKSTIKESFTNTVWQKVIEDIYSWCNTYYDQGVIHPYSYDDYDDYSSSESSFDYTMGFAGLVGG